MSTRSLDAPPVGQYEAAELCARFYFRPTAIRALDGYEDANFRMQNEAGERFVLKIGVRPEATLPIELERLVLGHLERRDWVGVPRRMQSRNGRFLESVDLGGRRLDVRMLSWLDGVPMARLERCSDELLRSLGRFLGRLDIALDVLEPARERITEWDLALLVFERPRLDLIPDASGRGLVDRSIDGFLECREASGDRLPRSLIHGDANDHNVVVSSQDPASARLVGLIDFGDLVVTETVYELAIAATYVGLERENPWIAALPLVAGYHEARPLVPAERRMLLPAIRARLALSVSMAARRHHEGTADAYAVVSERGAWEALRRLSRLDETEAERSLARAIEGEA